MSWDPTIAGSTSQASNQEAQTTNNAVPSAARTTTGSSGSQDARGATTLSVIADVTAVSGTGPSMVLSIEWSHDGAAWATVDGTPDAFAAITAASKRVKSFPVKARFWRATWTITGTTPSFTFALHASYR